MYIMIVLVSLASNSKSPGPSVRRARAEDVRNTPKRKPSERTVLLPVCCLFITTTSVTTHNHEQAKLQQGQYELQ